MVDMPDLGNFWVAAGMVIGGIGAGFAARAGWKNATGGGDREYAISGQASITDMGPIRDLAKQAETMAPRFEAMIQQQARTSAALERLVGVVEDFIEDQKTERGNDDAYQRGRKDEKAAVDNDEVKRRVKAIGARNARNRATAKRNAASSS
jgi:hypothetical protein